MLASASRFPTVLGGGWVVDVRRIRTRDMICNISILGNTRSQPALRCAQLDLSPNGRHCLSVDSRFARINSYTCGQYGFSVAQGGLKTISMAIPFLCPFFSVSD